MLSQAKNQSALTVSLSSADDGLSCISSGKHRRRLDDVQILAQKRVGAEKE
jgi:hypothetical protein